MVIAGDKLRDCVVAGLLVVGIVVGVGLLVWGVWLERERTDLHASPVIHSIAPVSQTVHTGLLYRWREIVAHHPAPASAIFETLVWLAIGASIIPHLIGPREGPVAFVIWALAIGPHEIGHFICMPFGYLPHVAGGSIWQILVFVLPAAWYFFVRHQVTGPLIFVAFAGHSLINLAVYIGDARARNLPLILGMGKDHHDWWNLLRELDLLEYDHILATGANVTGVIVILLACGLGILAAWVMPRTADSHRFRGNFWRALRVNLLIR